MRDRNAELPYLLVQVLKGPMQYENTKRPKVTGLHICTNIHNFSCEEIF